MEENKGESTSSIFNEVAEFLSENSDTLSTLSTEIVQQQPAIQKVSEWNLGNAPTKTEDSPNYELFKQASEEGDNTALIDTGNTSVNLQAAVNMLLKSPELKEYIGQYALSNDVEKNIESIQRAISNQKNFENTPERIGEVDGEVFTGGEAFFLQELLNRIQNSDAANTFFTQLREQINTEVVQKIENKEQQKTENKEPEDALSKTKKLLNEREGELVEDLTTAEAWDEMRRILTSPEYHRAQTEEIGYDAEIGHPDLEIRTYLDEMKKWRKQLPHPETWEPEKPKNYEERLNKPKENYDRYIKEGKTHEESLSTIYSQPVQQEQTAPINQSNTEKLELKEGINIEPNNTEKLELKEGINIEPNNTEKLELKEGINIEPNKLFTEQTPLVQNIEPTNLFNPIQQDFNEANFTDLLSNFSSPQETLKYETTSELPTQELFTQAEQSTDENSNKILANTEKTNTSLQTLTQLLATIIQTGALQAQGNNNQPIPVPIPTSSGNTDPGITDAMATAGQGMISDIRGKFIYPI
jgi:hypothetical protein